METWRIVAAALLVLAGLAAVPMIMAKVRDRTQSSASVLLSGAVSLTALAVLTLLVLTVLPPIASWVAAVAVVAAVGVLLLTG
ncbi:hypothetical protein [Amycolatopsis magusensis]|uniref:Formate hydrogenlyase subunit 3/multisubunit Na+/H+ antiporter MnhD subunit n=1 Tax=Amycolatopsis magusensis TaxID=882444 RepID=A0ABS4PKE2_9PSEU|nr:hypothetical protein [Amycolatopsis magusensis]MBP2179318.1 formate hydrogenlyase subunit 3/multisubunit Na+/H+ antiporter MnhD subunit [Amycolatopsis magusensis]